ncbi:MAG: BACON domain-containing protein [Bacteroidales bacterium]|nr:BACON domain-containing protein [Bacteroidales bacterium]
MRFKRFFAFAIMAAALLLSSCEDYSVGTNIYPALGEMGPEGGQITTTFVSNATWTASTEDEGISFTPESGIAGTWTITVTVPASTLDVEKTYKVKLQAKYGSSTASTRYFIITQHPKR